MIKECNFKSKVKHHDSLGCDLTPSQTTCPGEEHCVLYRTYYHLERAYDESCRPVKRESSSVRMIRESKRIDDSNWGIISKKKKVKK